MQIFYRFAVALQPSWTGGVDIITSFVGSPCFIMAKANLSVMSKITEGAGAHSPSAYHHWPGMSCPGLWKFYLSWEQWWSRMNENFLFFFLCFFWETPEENTCNLCGQNNPRPFTLKFVVRMFPKFQIYSPGKMTAGTSGWSQILRINRKLLMQLMLMVVVCVFVCGGQLGVKLCVSLYACILMPQCRHPPQKPWRSRCCSALCRKGV